MVDPRWKVVSWGTGNLGKVGIRHFAQNPAFELVGVAVFDPTKAGKDAGEIAGIEPLGIAATNDIDAILALDADCVFYTPRDADVDTICRMLRAGKNVASATGYFYPTADKAADYERIEMACAAGGTSYFGSGIHPGFVGDQLPVVLSRITSRVDKVTVCEVVNFAHSGPGAASYLKTMGYGVSPDEFRTLPNLLTNSVQYFRESMACVAEALGQSVEEVRLSEIELGLATQDIDFHGNTIVPGTVAAQRHEWTGWHGGKPLIVYQAVYTLGYANIEPVWDMGDIHYRVTIDGDPPTEVALSGRQVAGSVGAPYGFVWTAMACVNAIPAICQAPPGILTHRDLGWLQPQGLVRPTTERHIEV
jgi:hypothetical protein